MSFQLTGFQNPAQKIIMSNNNITSNFDNKKNENKNSTKATKNKT